VDGNYAGIMELGVPKEKRNKVYKMAKNGENDKFAFIEPVLCNVKYRNVTKAGLLRLPSFVSF
jgi:DNA ligase 1